MLAALSQLPSASHALRYPYGHTKLNPAAHAAAAPVACLQSSPEKTRLAEGNEPGFSRREEPQNST